MNSLMIIFGIFIAGMGIFLELQKHDPTKETTYTKIECVQCNKQHIDLPPGYRIILDKIDPLAAITDYQRVWWRRNGKYLEISDGPTTERYEVVGWSKRK